MNKRQSQQLSSPSSAWDGGKNLKKKKHFSPLSRFSLIYAAAVVWWWMDSRLLYPALVEVYTHIYYIYTIQACFYSGVIFWVFVTPEKRRRFRWCFQPQQQQKREDKKEKELHLLCRGKIYRFAITTMQLLYFVVYKWSRALTLSCGITSYNIYIYILYGIYLFIDDVSSSAKQLKWCEKGSTWSNRWVLVPVLV